MTRRRHSAVALLAMAATCAVLALVLPGSAAAAHRESVAIALNGAPYSEQPRGQLLDVDGIAPGGSASGSMGVRSGMGESAELLLRFVGVRDAENGCGPPERVVDRSCGSGPGDLGRQLTFTIDVAGSEHGAFIQQWTGTAAQLERGVDVGVGFGPGSSRWVRLRAALPATVGNEIESDSFQFGIRVVLQASEGVAGATLHRGSGSGGSGTSHVDTGTSSGLGFTGVPAALLVAAAALLAAAGGAVLIGARRRR